MTRLEELKLSTRESVEAQREALARAIGSTIVEVKEARKGVRDALLDIVSHIRTTYQVTVAQARDAETVDQVAQLWKETHDFYSNWLEWWEERRSAWFADEELFIYLGELIKSLERGSAQGYEFHA